MFVFLLHFVVFLSYIYQRDSYSNRPPINAYCDDYASTYVNLRTCNCKFNIHKYISHEQIDDTKGIIRSLISKNPYNMKDEYTYIM